MTLGAQKYQTPSRETSSIEIHAKETCSLHHDEKILSRGLLTEDHNNNKIIVHNNTNSLGMFNRIDQDHR
jgi:hypothetical protein